jgi:hypothetical protein
MAGRFHLYFVLCVSFLFGGLYSQESRACETLQRLRQHRDGSDFLNIKSGLQRPAVQTFLDSDIYPLRVHGSNATSMARLERFVQMLEMAWERQVIDMGFDAPLSDGEAGGSTFYDVYLTSVFNQSAVTVAESVSETLDGTAMPSFILIDAQTLEEEEGLIIEHEFQHALQFAMDPLASFFLFEASAVYMESIAYPQNLKYEEVLQDYQDWPNASFFTDGVQWQDQTGVISYYEYGGVLFLIYLEETYGDNDGTFISELWQLGKNSEGEENEPDFIDVLRSKELDLSLLLLDFSVWRALVNVWAQSDEGPHNGAAWSGNSNMARFTLTPSGFSDPILSFGLKDQLYHAGCLAFDYFSNDQETTLFLDVLLENEQKSWLDELGLSAAFFDSEERLVASWSKLPQEVSWPFEIQVPYNQYIVFSLCDVSAQWDTEDSLVPMDFQLYIGDSLPLEVNDAGNFDEPDIVTGQTSPIDETGCNCDSHTSSAPSLRYAVLWFLTCLGIRRRT